MEEIYESIAKIISKHTYNIIPKIKNLTINGEKIYSIEIIDWRNSRPDEIVITDYDGNTESIDGLSDAILYRILKKVKQYDQTTMATNSKPKKITRIDFMLNDNGKYSQYCFNDFNDQEFLYKHNDTWSDSELITVLQRLTKNRIIQPKRCKGIIRINEEGTLFLRFRYYAKHSNLLEKKVHRRTLPLEKWSPRFLDNFA